MSGISTLVANEKAFEDRMSLVMKDAKSLIKTGPILVSVERFKRKGSLSQSALFHELCGWIAKFWNARHPENPTSKERVKTDLKIKYGVKVVEYSLLDDRDKPRLASWSEYSVEQRSSLITATLIWMGEHGIPDLPDLPATEYEGYRECASVAS